MMRVLQVSTFAIEQDFNKVKPTARRCSMYLSVLNGHAPHILLPVSPIITKHALLRSAQDSTRLSVPKFRRKALQSAADKSFSLAAPALWNNLPTSIRTANSVSSFKRCLKTHLFPQ